MPFKNPTGYWEYVGGFSVELTETADKTIAPLGITFTKGNTVVVPNGRIKQVMGGIQLYAEQQPFFWGYSYIKAIRDVNDDLIWQNWDYR